MENPAKPRISGRIWPQRPIPKAQRWRIEPETRFPRENLGWGEPGSWGLTIEQGRSPSPQRSLDCGRAAARPVLDRRVRRLRGEDLPEVFLKQIVSLTITRTRCSTFGHGLGLRRQERPRQWVWDRFSAEGVARFPFPPHGRIPNFAGAEVAAARLLDIEPWKSATAIKVNPDLPQRPLSRSAAPRHHRFRTDAQIARRLQKARSAPDSARQDRSGRKLVARRPLVRGGGPRIEVRRLSAGGNRIRTIGPAEKETAAERPRGRPSSPRETTWA